jgi:uncharacterized phage-associated protein
VFNERKVAQMAAYLLKRRGGTMSHLKLIKLLYLADREALNSYGASISGDSFFSLPNGPVLSRTLNLMAGVIESETQGWETWISDRAEHQVSLRQDFELDALDYLSRADIDILDSVWQQFGTMTRWQLVEYTHSGNCPEWENPNGSSAPISNIKIFSALGKSTEDATLLASDIEAEKTIDRIFASL